MAEWVYAVEGTETGHSIALALALLAAFLHAVFGALQKGRHDPWLSRGAMDFGYATIMLPVAILLVPAPEPALWPICLEPGLSTRCIRCCKDTPM